MSECTSCTALHEQKIKRWEDQITHHCRTCPAHYCDLLTDDERAELIAMQETITARFEQILQTKQ